MDDLNNCIQLAINETEKRLKNLQALAIGIDTADEESLIKLQYAALDLGVPAKVLCEKNRRLAQRQRQLVIHKGEIYGFNLQHREQMRASTY